MFYFVDKFSRVFGIDVCVEMSISYVEADTEVYGRNRITRACRGVEFFYERALNYIVALRIVRGLFHRLILDGFDVLVKELRHLQEREFAEHFFYERSRISASACKFAY